jgi:hypothetical protein
MKYKDHQLLESAYTSVIKEDTDNETFVAKEVPVSVFREGSEPYEKVDHDYQKQTDVQYKIDIDFTPWGIEAIHANVLKVAPVKVTITHWASEDGGQDQEEHIVIDPNTVDIITEYSNMKSPVNEHGQVHPQEVQVTTDKDSKVIKTVVII